MSELSWGWADGPDGVVGVVADQAVVRRIYYVTDQKQLNRLVRRDFPEATKGDNPLLVSALTQLSEYFDGRRTAFDLPLAHQDLSVFGRTVHQTLCQVPFGDVVTYAELASRSGSPRAARAVGRVMATNPFPLVVPCHRVIRADGQCGAYSAAQGVSSKQRLIDHERKFRRHVND